ncbi:MAG: YbfB/YjiJ family MFS transporter [Candidatus Protistobacter heckmanni]|nr:YbfB/YjiJ family MFS transporter [Candidatus Protistobacter heckmanni]
MQNRSHPVGSPALVAVAALLALAVAMGIGRFAFTPLLPMMQADAGLTLQQGGWLASVNYIGYLLGALMAARLPLSPTTAIRLALALTAVVTLAMGWTESLAAWLVLRFAAGVTSAWVLVNISSWALGRPQLSGVVYAGVGVGIAVAELFCLALAHQGVSSGPSWVVLGAVALLFSALAWRAFRGEDAAASPAPGGSSASAASATASGKTAASSMYAFSQAQRAPEVAAHWPLVLCYGAFGFGYILPATYLPAQARQLVQDPAVFGLAWPVFGVAAAASTLFAAKLAARFNRRVVWAVCQSVRAVGVILPALWTHPVSILLAALCVGGTFMVVTMVGMQEARAVAAAAPQPLIAAMTSAFAAGQIVGPLLASALGGRLEPALWLASASLILSLPALWIQSKDSSPITTGDPR